MLYSPLMRGGGRCVDVKAAPLTNDSRSKYDCFYL